MKNAVMSVKGNILTIQIDLSKSLGPSKSGMNTLIATSAGNQPVPGKEAIKVGLNVYMSNGEK